MAQKDKTLQEVFKKCPYYGHRRLEVLLAFIGGIAIGISVGYYLFWYQLMQFIGNLG